MDDYGDGASALVDGAAIDEDIRKRASATRAASSACTRGVMSRKLTTTRWSAPSPSRRGVTSMLTERWLPSGRVIPTIQPRWGWPVRKATATGRSSGGRGKPSARVIAPRDVARDRDQPVRAIG